ncbi:MAG: YHS domain-containing protein [Nitrososphaerota archaeon]|nr:YHS domain-containing protein [Nitrososphaerota archaeon]MDG7023764.1 YHS domain-containing protein [Nitrososphaerota archaeon]
MAKDPVCGMQVSETTSFKSEHMGQTYYFCCQADKTSFDSNPMKYLGGHQMSMGHH